MTAPGEKTDAPKSAAANTPAANEAKALEGLVKKGHPEQAQAKLQEDTKRDAKFAAAVRAAMQQHDKENSTRFYPAMQIGIPNGATQTTDQTTAHTPDQKAASQTKPQTTDNTTAQSTPSQPSAPNIEALKRDADAIHKASGADNWVFRFADTDAINKILENKSDAERQALDQIYKVKFGRGLEAEMRKFETGSDLDKFLNVFQKQDSNQSNQIARRIHEDLLEHNNLIGGRSHDQLEKDIRTTLATQNSAQVAEIQAEYFKTYGQSLLADINGNLSLQKSTRDIATTYLKTGNDKRGDVETAKLIDSCLSAKDSQAFDEVMSTASQAARKNFLDNGGEKKLTDAFGHWYSNASVKHAMDYAKEGKLDAATLVQDNTHLFNNTKGIELAVKNLTDDERKMYDNGKALSTGQTVSGLSAADAQKAKDYYTRLHTALTSASNDTEVLKWEDMITNKGDGSFIAQLANHRHTFWFNDSNEKICADIRNMSETDWTQARQHPEWRDELRTMLRTLNKTPDEISDTLKVYDTMLSAKDFGKAEAAGKIPALDQINSCKHWYGNDADGLFNAISKMSPDEQNSYRTDKDYRAKIDEAIKNSIPDSRRQGALERALAQVQNGHTPDGDLLISLDRLSNLDGSKTRDAVLAIEKAFKEEPSLQGKIKNDAQLAEQFKQAVQSAFGEDYDNFGKPFVTDGRLPLEMKLHLDQDIFTNYDGVFADLQNATAEERAKLKSDTTYRNQTIGFLDDDRQKIAMAVVDQGKLNIEDKIRAAAVGWGGSTDIVQYLKSIKPNELAQAQSEYARKYGSSMMGDLCAKLGGQDKDEAERVFTQNLSIQERASIAASQTENARSGVGSWISDNAFRSGTGAQADDALNQTTAALSDKNRLDQAIAAGNSFLAGMTPEQIAQLKNQANARLAGALQEEDQTTDNHVEAKKAAAEYVGDGAIAAVAVASMIVTGGADTPLVLSLAAWGAGIKVGTNAVMEGNNYDWSLKNVATDATIGSVTGATSVIGPGEIAAVFGIGKAAAEGAATAAIKEIGTETLKQGGEELLESGTTRIVYNALASGAKKLESKQFLKLAESAVDSSITGTARREAVAALAASLEKNVADRMAKGVVRTATHHALNTAGGALGGGAGGMAQGVTEWDSRKSLAGNLGHIATTTGFGAFSGAIGGGGMSVGIHTLSSGFNAARVGFASARDAFTRDAAAVASTELGGTIAAASHLENSALKPPVNQGSMHGIDMPATAEISPTKSQHTPTAAPDNPIRKRDNPATGDSRAGLAQADAVEPAKVSDGTSRNPGAQLKERTVVRDFQPHDGSDRPPVRTYKIVSGQEVIDRFRVSKGEKAGTVEVQEVNADGTFGEKRSIYLEHRTGSTINHEAAASADLLATCDPAQLPPSLRSKVPIQEHGTVYLAIDRDGDQIAISTPEAINSATARMGEGHSLLRLGEHPLEARELAELPAEERKWFLDEMDYNDCKNVAKTLDAQAIANLSGDERRAFVKDITQRYMDQVALHSSEEKQEALKYLMEASKNDRDLIDNLWTEVINRDFTPEETADLARATLSIRKDLVLVSSARAAIYKLLKACPNGDPAFLHLASGQWYTPGVLSGKGGVLRIPRSEFDGGFTKAEFERLKPGRIQEELKAAIDDEIRQSLTADNMRQLTAKQQEEVLSRYFHSSVLDSSSAALKVLLLPQDLVNQLRATDVGDIAGLLVSENLDRQPPEVRAQMINALMGRLEHGSVSETSVGDTAFYRMYQALGTDNAALLSDRPFAELVGGMREAKLKEIPVEERTNLYRSVQERLEAVNEKIESAKSEAAGTTGSVAMEEARTAEVALMRATSAFAGGTDQESKLLTAQFALSLSERQLASMPDSTFNNLLSSLQRKSLEAKHGDIQKLMKKLISSASERAEDPGFALSDKSRNFLIRMTEPDTLRDLSSQEVKYIMRQERAVVDNFIEKNAGKANGIEWSTEQSLRKSLHDINKNSLDKSPVPRSELEAMFVGMPESEQEKFLGILQARKRFMSVESMRGTLREMAQGMETDLSLSRDKYWRLMKEIHVVVTGNSSPGHELAYEFRKATGIDLKFHVMEPESAPPPGNWFFFDKVPTSGDPNFKTFQKWMKAPGVADRIKVPDTIQDFYSGPNLYDALGNTSENQKLANALSLAAAQERTTAGGITTGVTQATHISTADRALAAERILTGYDREALRLRQAQTLLMLAHETTRAGRTGVQLESLARLLSLEEVATHISPTDQMRQMRDLHSDLKYQFGDKLKDALIITDRDAMGSSHSATYLYKLINEVPDKNFVTTAQAKVKLGSQPDLPIVVIDDMVYTGVSGANRAAALAKALGVEPNRITLAVGGAYEKGEKLIRDQGYNLLHADYYKDIYQGLADRADIRQNDDDALKKVIGEGWKGDKDKQVAQPITAGVSTPYMAPNNSSPFVVRLAKYHGIGRANAMAIAQETEETANREAAQQEARTAARELISTSRARDAELAKQRPLKADALQLQLNEMRESMVDARKRGFDLSDDDAETYLYCLADDHKDDPAWASFAKLSTAYSDKSNPIHPFAKQAVDLEIAASRVEASSLKAELSAAWVFKGAPSACPKEFKWTIDFAAEKLASDPANRDAIDALRRLQAEAQNGNEFIKPMATYILEQIMLGH